MEWVLGLLLGLGLSAACGFRVFVPALIVSLAAHYGFIDLSDSFAWLASPMAIILLSTATIFEILAYFIPWLDHVMDVMMGPAAVIAGTVLTSAMLVNIGPELQWTLALIAGGGTAATLHTGTAALRGASTAVSGGLTNGAVSSFELGSSVIGTILSLVMPILAALIAIMAVLFTIFYIRKLKRLIVAKYKHKDPLAITTIE